MSEIRVNNVIADNGLDAVNFSKGINVSSGIITATTFSGSGASLTSLPAGNLTGTLPAISGANLTNVRNFPQVSVSSNRVLISSDAGKHIINTGSGGWTINTSSGFSVGDVIRIVNGSGSNQILYQAGGVTTYSRRDSGTSGDHSIAARGAAIIICTASNQYYVSGDI